ncbi:MAG: chemotaxis protein CheW [Hyphomonadaceae bacterium]|nr:chemotaxis protein CheW [Hyphomonadaceae bacterium]
MGATFDEESAPRERQPAAAGNGAVWALEDGDMQAGAQRSLQEISAEFEAARALLREAFRIAPEEALPIVRLAQVAQETQAEAERELAALRQAAAPAPEIVRTLIVQCAGILAALPEASVVEVLRGGLKRVQHPDGRVSLRVRGRAVKFARLADLLRLDAGPDEERCAIILRDGDRAFAILVEEAYGAEEVTLEEGRRSRVVAGAAMLSDGDAMLLLDVSGLAAAIGSRAISERSPKEEARRVPLLVFRGTRGAVEAAPLWLISRVEPLEEAVDVDGVWMAAQRTGLIPTLDSRGASVKAAAGASLLVFARGAEEVALVAAEIIETAECFADAPLQRAGAVGALQLNGRAAALVEIDALWRALEPPDLARELTPELAPEAFPELSDAPRILVVGRAFARLAVCLPACDLTFEGEPEAALTRHDAGERFELIIVDAESVTGQRVMRVLSRAAAWRDIPILALPRDGDEAELVAAIEDAISAV